MHNLPDDAVPPGTGSLGQRTSGQDGRSHHSGRPRCSRRALLTTAAAAVVAVGIAITLVLTLGGAGNITARGSVEVDDFTGQCLSDPGFSDITEGIQVVVTDSGGSVVGTSQLGYDTQASALQSSLQPGLSVCIYTFKVTVPGRLARYGITVSHRGTVWFTPAQMAEGPGLSVSSGGSGI